MGQTFRFRCPECGYTAEVSGKADAGMNVLTETQLCNRCLEIVDVVIGPSPISPDFERIPKVEKECPKCKGRNLQKWTNMQCPKCGGKMKKGDLIVLWD